MFCGKVLLLLFKTTFFVPLRIISLFCEIFCFPTPSPGLGIFIFSKEKFNRAKYLEANSFSFPLKLWFAVIRTRSHEQVAASSIHSLGLRRPWPAVPSVPQPETEVSSWK